MMFWNREPKTMPVRDVQSEAVAAIIQGSAILPSKRLTNAIYTALLDNRDMSVAELDDLANKISRLAWINSKRSCEAAIEFVRDNAHIVVMECVPK